MSTKAFPDRIIPHSIKLHYPALFIKSAKRDSTPFTLCQKWRDSTLFTLSKNTFRSPNSYALAESTHISLFCYTLKFSNFRIPTLEHSSFHTLPRGVRQVSRKTNGLHMASTCPRLAFWHLWAQYGATGAMTKGVIRRPRLVSEHEWQTLKTLPR